MRPRAGSTGGPPWSSRARRAVPRCALSPSRSAAPSSSPCATPFRPTATSSWISRWSSGGNTRSDAKFDVDGAAFTLAAYAELGKSLGDRRFLVDGEGITLGRTPRFHGQHIAVPRHGVAVHVNAFNFPAWGLAEKAAVALLAGVPVVSKPATSTCLLAHRIVEILVERNVLPEGALSLLVGSAGDLLEHLGPQDVVAFTGSSDTALKIRQMPAVLRHSVRVNVEADSLNAAVLGPDAAPGGETCELFLKDVLRDMTQKAGQKCTAIRRVLVPGGRAPTGCGTSSWIALPPSPWATPRPTACAWGRSPRRPSSKTCATGCRCSPATAAWCSARPR